MINIVPELFVQGEADHRIQRWLREAEGYRLARAVPTRTSRNKLREGSARAFVINAGHPLDCCDVCEADTVGVARLGLTRPLPPDQELSIRLIWQSVRTSTLGRAGTINLRVANTMVNSAPGGQTGRARPCAQNTVRQLRSRRDKDRITIHARRIRWHPDLPRSARMSAWRRRRSIA